ncbi:hypothetical protein HPB48_015929 [Haemaphysalis longicornis]|uniref:Uncharacterized protein n=1 Tax=Haemaphysalis longicornis TaxID=44386 RepID=A0A9J6GWM8_HAELO|nr:hypothetical protein HPB48_015929 [Haemaphysalis longicornis]
MLIGLQAAHKTQILNWEQDKQQLCMKVVKTRLLIENKKSCVAIRRKSQKDEKVTRLSVCKIGSTSHNKPKNEKKSYQPAHKKDENICQRPSGIRKKKARGFVCGKIRNTATDSNKCLH